MPPQAKKVAEADEPPQPLTGRSALPALERPEGVPALRTPSARPVAELPRWDAAEVAAHAFQGAPLPPVPDAEGDEPADDGDEPGADAEGDEPAAEEAAADEFASLLQFEDADFALPAHLAGRVDSWARPEEYLSQFQERPPEPALVLSVASSQAELESPAPSEAASSRPASRQSDAGGKKKAGKKAPKGKEPEPEESVEDAPAPAPVWRPRPPVIVAGEPAEPAEQAVTTDEPLAEAKSTASLAQASTTSSKSRRSAKSDAGDGGDGEGEDGEEKEEEGDAEPPQPARKLARGFKRRWTAEQEQQREAFFAAEAAKAEADAQAKAEAAAAREAAIAEATEALVGEGMEPDEALQRAQADWERAQAQAQAQAAAAARSRRLSSMRESPTLLARDAKLAAAKDELTLPTEPEGEEVEAPMASLFRVVQFFANNVGAEQPFLWEAIHPRQYNPRGEYWVKLWVAGAWRRVAVDDRIPLDAEGAPVMLSTVDPFELWPLLLSKAVYKALSWFGLEGVFTEGDAVPRTTALTLHLLTGWLPEMIPAVPDFDRVCEAVPTSSQAPAHLMRTARSVRSLKHNAHTASGRSLSRSSTRTPGDAVSVSSRAHSSSTTAHDEEDPRTVVEAHPEAAEIVCVCARQQLGKSKNKVCAGEVLPVLEAYAPPMHPVQQAGPGPETPLLHLPRLGKPLWLPYDGLVTYNLGVVVMHTSYTSEEVSYLSSSFLADPSDGIVAAESVESLGSVASAQESAEPSEGGGDGEGEGEGEGEAEEDEDVVVPLYRGPTLLYVGPHRVHSSSLEHESQMLGSEADGEPLPPLGEEGGEPVPEPEAGGDVADVSAVEADAMALVDEPASPVASESAFDLPDEPAPWTRLVVSLQPDRPVEGPCKAVVTLRGDDDEFVLRLETGEHIDSRVLMLPPTEHLFRVSVRAPCGYCLVFSSSSVVDVGDAADVLERHGLRSVVQAAGVVEPLAAGEWHVVTRQVVTVLGRAAAAALAAASSSSSVEEQASVGSSVAPDAEGEDQDQPDDRPAEESEEVVEEEDEAVVDDEDQQDDDDPATVFLHVAFEQQKLARFCSLQVIDNDYGDVTELPSLEPRPLQLRPNEGGYTVLVSLLSLRQPLPRDAWRLVVSSERALPPLREVAARKTRFQGDYVPNKYYQLFGDQLRLPAPREGGGGEEDEASLEQIDLGAADQRQTALRLTTSWPDARVELLVRDALTREVVLRRSGRRSVTLPCLPRVASPPVAEDAVEAEESVEEAVVATGYVLEARLDSLRWTVPGELRSVLPFYHPRDPPAPDSEEGSAGGGSEGGGVSAQASLESLGSAGEAAVVSEQGSQEVPPLLVWWLDVVAPSDAGGAGLEFDLTKDRTEAAVQASWAEVPEAAEGEEEQPEPEHDRATLAKAARLRFLGRGEEADELVPPGSPRAPVGEDGESDAGEPDDAFAERIAQIAPAPVQAGGDGEVVVVRSAEEAAALAAEADARVAEAGEQHQHRLEERDQLRGERAKDRQRHVAEMVAWRGAVRKVHAASWRAREQVRKDIVNEERRRREEEARRRAEERRAAEEAARLAEEEAAAAAAAGEEGSLVSD